MIETGYLHVLAAFSLVILSLVLTFYKKIPVSKEIGIGAIRGFIQLAAIGYALEFIFDSKSIWLILASVVIMILVASYTAGNRAEHFKGGFSISLIALSIGSVVTLGLMLALDIISPEARFIIPLAGMVVSNAMNATSIVYNRIGSDLKNNRLAIETSLSLGKDWKTASREYYKSSVKASMISILNFFKTVGIVALPGAMTGMILAGASPLKAVLIQIIVGYMILASITVSSIIAAELSIRKFFNRAEQFVDPQ